jgi:hypothetical protein
MRSRKLQGVPVGAGYDAGSLQGGYGFGLATPAASVVIQFDWRVAIHAPPKFHDRLLSDFRVQEQITFFGRTRP